MKVGAKIPPKTFFASLIPDDAKLELHAFVDETVATALRAEQSGYVAPSAAPRSRLAAIVSEVATYPSVEGKFHVVVKIDGQPDGFQLVPGMKGKAKISTGAAAADSISIPTSALHESADGSYAVKLKDGDQTREVPVTLGAESNGSILVLAGLEAGQVLVTPDSKPAEPKN
jgi:multidrug efflux pump subunit AcrA (membrane-fusion protein)